MSEKTRHGRCPKLSVRLRRDKRSGTVVMSLTANRASCGDSLDALLCTGRYAASAAHPTSAIFAVVSGVTYVSTGASKRPSRALFRFAQSRLRMADATSPFIDASTAGHGVPVAPLGNSQRRRQE